MQLGLLMTVLGFAGLFAVFTYIQPILARVTGFSPAAIAAVLLVFGAGFSVGNLAGGRFADRNLGLAVARHAGGPAGGRCWACRWRSTPRSRPWCSRACSGATAFATVAPLQLRVLEAAGATGQTLASSLNIAAFNLGNALGAWAGGEAIAHGPGLESLPLVGAGLTAAGLAVALASRPRARRAPAYAA